MMGIPIPCIVVLDAVSKFDESQWANGKLPFMYMMGSNNTVKNPSLKTRMMG